MAGGLFHVRSLVPYVFFLLSSFFSTVRLSFKSSFTVQHSRLSSKFINFESFISVYI